jgi:biotin transport system substrate-specific component
MPRVEPRAEHRTEVPSWLLNSMLAVAGSALVALAARFSLPIPGTPVPLSLVNLAVLLVGMAMGAKRGFAALVLYLAEGLSGLPVFSPTGPGGLAQLLGPTGGYLAAYPAVAFIAGWIFQNGKTSFKRALAGATAGELLLFALGVSWLLIVFHVPVSQAAAWGLYPFLAAEVLKVAAAAGIATRWHMPKTR